MQWAKNANKMKETSFEKINDGKHFRWDNQKCEPLWTYLHYRFDGISGGKSHIKEIMEMLTMTTMPIEYIQQHVESNLSKR